AVGASRAPPRGVPCAAANHSMSAATLIMIATPAAETANCIGMPPKNSLRIRCPSTERRIPRQKIWRELRPQITKGRAPRPGKKGVRGGHNRSQSKPKGKTVSKKKNPKVVFPKKNPQGPAADQKRNWIVKVVKGPLNPNHEPRQCEDRREAKQPATAEPG